MYFICRFDCDGEFRLVDKDTNVASAHEMARRAMYIYGEQITVLYSPIGDFDTAVQFNDYI